MNQENETYLVKNYPHFYRVYKTPMQSLMCYGFACGDGWMSIIKTLSENIVVVLNEHNIAQENFEVVQIKEKFGGLRYYYEWHTSTSDEVKKIVDNLVSEAEGLSIITCEFCSAPGKRGGKGWILTLCDLCRKKREQDREASTI